MRIVVIDDRFPNPCKGYGYPRSHAVLSGLLRLGVEVTFLPSHGDSIGQRHYNRLRRLPGRFTLETRQPTPDLLGQLAANHDAAWVSRPKNLRAFLSMSGRERFRTVVYDAEALGCIRTQHHWSLTHDVSLPPPAKVAEASTDELAMIRAADLVLSVSQREHSVLQSAGVPNIIRVAHVHPVVTQPTGPAGRRGILFFGGFKTLEVNMRAREWWEISPNEDALFWFLENVAQHVSGRGHPIIVAGHNSRRLAKWLAPSHRACVEVLGDVPNTDALLDSARLMVVPTRYAAGLPWKVTEALARGLPVVCSTLIASQLPRGTPVAVAKNALEFTERIGEFLVDENLWWNTHLASIATAARFYSATTFAKSLKSVLRWLESRISVPPALQAYAL